MDVSGWWDAMLARRSSISTIEMGLSGWEHERVFVPYSETIDLAGCGKTRFVVRHAHHERDQPLMFSTATVRPELVEG
jgi:hypothetical protein